MIREQVREILDTLAETARDMILPDDWDESIAQAVNEVMSLTPLRLAQLAEQPNRKLVVIDTQTRTPMRVVDEEYEYRRVPYAQVVAE